MSMELHVVTTADGLPAADQIMADLRTDGVELTLAPIDWSTQEGYLPMLLNGMESGVEVNTSPASQCQEILAAFGLSAGNVTDVISLRWGGDSAEAACALALAASLSSLAGGVILDPQAGKSLPRTDALDRARECMKELS